MSLLVSILTETPSCHKPLLDKMVSAGGPQWRGAQAQWLYKCGSGRRLLLMILIQDADNARIGNGVPAFGRALRAPVQAFGRHSVPPVQASAGLRPGTPCPQCRPSAGARCPQCRPVPAQHSVPPVQTSAGTPCPQCRPVPADSRAPRAGQCRPCFRVPNAPSHRVHVQASAALPLPAWRPSPGAIVTYRV